MSMTMPSSTITSGQESRRSRPAAPAIGPRSLLLMGCIAAAATAAALGRPDAFIQADPGLALLLRGMAAIKSLIVLGAVALLLWRLGHPLSRRATASYIGAAWVLTGSTAMIWQLSFIPLAAVAFHVAGFASLVTAWRDDHVGPKSRVRWRVFPR